MRNGAAQHHDTMARVTAEAAPANGSWWLGHPRDGWARRCAQEFQRMRHTKFGQVTALNYAAEVVVDRPRSERPFAS